MRARLGTRPRIRYQTSRSFCWTVAQKNWPPPIDSYGAPCRLHHSGTDLILQRPAAVTAALLFRSSAQLEALRFFSVKRMNRRPALLINASIVNPNTKAV